MELIEFITSNFWLLLFILLLCISGAPGIAIFDLAIYLASGNIPGWLYCVSALLMLLVRVDRIDGKPKNKINYHIHKSIHTIDNGEDDSKGN